MKIKDNGQTVDVFDKNCPKRPCYWARPDPGSFTPGVGYKTRVGKNGKRIWLCGTREIRGCPSPIPNPE